MDLVHSPQRAKSQLQSAAVLDCTTRQLCYWSGLGWLPVGYLQWGLNYPTVERWMNHLRAKERVSSNSAKLDSQSMGSSIGNVCCLGQAAVLPPQACCAMPEVQTLAVERIFRAR